MKKLLAALLLFLAFVPNAALAQTTHSQVLSFGTLTGPGTGQQNLNIDFGDQPLATLLIDVGTVAGVTPSINFRCDSQAGSGAWFPGSGLGSAVSNGAVAGGLIGVSGRYLGICRFTSPQGRIGWTVAGSGGPSFSNVFVTVTALSSMPMSPPSTGLPFIGIGSNTFIPQVGLTIGQGAGSGNGANAVIGDSNGFLVVVGPTPVANPGNTFNPLLMGGLDGSNNVRNLAVDSSGRITAVTQGTLSNTATFNSATNVSLSMNGLFGAGFSIPAGTFVGTFVPEISYDSAVTWTGVSWFDPTGNTTTTNLVFASANTAAFRSILVPAGVTNVRVRASVYTAGSVVGTLNATAVSGGSLLTLSNIAQVAGQNIVTFGNTQITAGVPVAAQDNSTGNATSLRTSNNGLVVGDGTPVGNGIVGSSQSMLMAAEDLTSTKRAVLSDSAGILRVNGDATQATGVQNVADVAVISPNGRSTVGVSVNSSLTGAMSITCTCEWSVDGTIFEQTFCVNQFNDQTSASFTITAGANIFRYFTMPGGAGTFRVRVTSVANAPTSQTVNLRASNSAPNFFLAFGPTNVGVATTSNPVQGGLVDSTGAVRRLIGDLEGDVGIAGFDGTNPVRLQSASAANLSASVSNTTGTAGSGPHIVTAPGNWAVNANGTATTPSASRAAGAAGVRHVANCISISMGSGTTAGGPNVINLRDGATGAGTVLWSWELSAAANQGSTVTSVCGLNIFGTAATAMTLEFAAACATGQGCAVSLSGYDVQ